MMATSPVLAAAEEAPSSVSAVPQTILITGANSGIGYEACKRLSKLGHTVVLACRSLAKSQDAIVRIRQEEQDEAATATSARGGTGTLLAGECDLTSLASIRSFCETQLPALLLSSGDSTSSSIKSKGQSSQRRFVDAVCLNAGVALNTATTNVARTVDGFELTVGTNHFGHAYLTYLLLNQTAVNPTQGRIVVTASSVHDPASAGGAQGVPATLGNLQGLEYTGRSAQMVDGEPFNADKAYEDSKVRILN